jgi:hypothetical protein
VEGVYGSGADFILCALWRIWGWMVGKRGNGFIAIKGKNSEFYMVWEMIFGWNVICFTKGVLVVIFP